MATITGYTAERMKDIEDTTIVGGNVSAGGTLLLTTRAGAQYDAGNVIGPQGPQGAQGIQGPQGIQAPLPPWTPQTSYAAGVWVLSPVGEVVKSKVARTSAMTWSAAEAEYWGGTDEQMAFKNAGFAWSGSSQPWDSGPLSLDASGESASQRASAPAFAFAEPGAVSGTIRFLVPGTYDVIWFITPGGNPGGRQYTISASDESAWSTPEPNSLWRRFGGSNFIPDNSMQWESVVSAINIRVPKPNLQIRFQGQQTIGSTNQATIKIFRKGLI